MTVHERPCALTFHGSLYNPNAFLTGEEDMNPLLQLLRLYLKEGIAFVRRLRGEFALAIWDGREDKLHLVTDRFRVHPLLYYQDRDKLVFASHMKSLLACPFPLPTTINLEAIVDVVASSVIPTPKTIFCEVNKLPPGYVLTYQQGEIKLEPYWDISFLQSSGAGEAELSRRLQANFAEAVSVRLEGEADVDRIGTFLSGGVDSSTVTGVLTQLSRRPIKSFSIGFDEQRFNEIDYARIAAQAFGTEHHEYFVTPRDVYEAIPVLLEAFDEPFANASAIPTYFCSKVAREHGVEVLYAGDGGDELFAGNERYALQRLFDYYHRIPAWLRELLVQPLAFSLADGIGWEIFIKGKKYIQRANIPYPERLSSYGMFEVIPMQDLLEDHLLAAVEDDYNPQAPLFQHYSQAPACSELDRQLYIDLKLAISDNDLFKVTRTAEMAGVTVRFPFLDHRLAEFAATVPAHVKMRHRQLRSFFKKTYADLLPSEVRTKTKHGFGLPIPVWLRTDKRLNAMMHDLILGSDSIQRGYFRRQALETLVERHKTDETSFFGTILWNLMILELWCRSAVDKP
jgi:asparagine synthase (glutamine-hydrolysing)